MKTRIKTITSHGMKLPQVQGQCPACKGWFPHICKDKIGSHDCRPPNEYLREMESIHRQDRWAFGR